MADRRKKFKNFQNMATFLLIEATRDGNLNKVKQLIEEEGRNIEEQDSVMII